MARPSKKNTILVILANLDDSAVDRLPVEIDEGVYYGWAQIVRPENRTIYKMVASVGMNPFYHGEKKTLVIHIESYFLFIL